MSRRKKEQYFNTRNYTNAMLSKRHELSRQRSQTSLLTRKTDEGHEVPSNSARCRNSSTRPMLGGPGDISRDGTRKSRVKLGPARVNWSAEE